MSDRPETPRPRRRPRAYAVSISYRPNVFPPPLPSPPTIPPAPCRALRPPANPPPAAIHGSSVALYAPPDAHNATTLQQHSTQTPAAIGVAAPVELGLVASAAQHRPDTARPPLPSPPASRH